MAAMRWKAELDPSQFLDAINRIRLSVERGEAAMVKSFGSISTAVTRAAAILGAGVLSQRIYRAFEEQENAVRRLTFAISKVPGEADGAVESLKQLASEIQSRSNYGDEALLGIAANMASTGRIGQQAIAAAMQAAADLAAAFNQDIASVGESLKMALVAPEKAATRLQKAFGVIIPPDLRQRIDELAKSGDVASAQMLVLNAVMDQVGGTSEALQDPIKQVHGLVGDVMELLGTYVVPPLRQLLAMLRDLIQWTLDYAQKADVAAKAVLALAAALQAYRIQAQLAAKIQAATSWTGIGKGWAGLVIAAGAGLATWWLLSKAFDEAEKQAIVAIERQKQAAEEVRVAGEQARNAWVRLGVTEPEAVKTLTEGLGVAEEVFDKWAKKVEKSAELRDLRRSLAVGMNALVEVQWRAREKLKAGLNIFDDLQDIARIEGMINTLRQAIDIESGAADKLRELEHKIATFGMTADQIALFDLRNLGASDEILREIQKKMAQLQQMEVWKEQKEAQEKATKEIDEAIEKARQRIDVLKGKTTEIDVEIEKFAKRGVAEEKLEEYRKLLEEQDALEEKSAGGKSPSPAALAGTREAYSTLARAANAQLSQAGDKQLAEAKKHTQLLQNIHDKLGVPVHIDVVDLT